MRKLQNPKVASEAAEPEMQNLLERVAELEAENAALRPLQETVRRNAKIFHAMFNKSREGFLLVTPQLTLLKVIHSVLGNSDEELAGCSLLETIHMEDVALVTEAFRRLLDTTKSVTIHCRVVDKRGHWHWMEIEMTDMLDDPDIQAILWNTRHITEREKHSGDFFQTPTGLSAPE